MIFRSVVGKLWLTIIAIVAVLFLILSIFILQYFKTYTNSISIQSLTNTGVQVSNIIKNTSNTDEAVKIIEQIIPSFDVNMIILDNPNDFSVLESKFSKKDIEALINNFREVVNISAESIDNYLKTDSDNDYLAIAFPIYDGLEVRNILILYESLDSMFLLSNNLRVILLVFVGIASVITTMFSFFLSHKITHPIRQMQKAADAISKGNYKARVDIRTSDEIGDLAAGFNQMSSDLDSTVLALSNEKDKLTNILKSMADGVITISSDGKVLMTNSPAEVFLLGDAELLPSLREMLDIVVKRGSSEKKDIQLNDKVLSVTMDPVFSGYKIGGAVTLLRDTTYEKKLNKLREDFLANVSHELRTPISMIQGYSEAIIDDIVETPEDTKELTRIIYDESLRMGRLVNDLLDLAKIESGFYKLQYSRVELKKMIEKITRKFNSLLNEQEIELLCEISPELNDLFIDIDADRIEQVLTNLIDNAIRHTEKGDTISLNLKKLYSNKVLIEVADSGEGISKEDIPFLFERFYKADKARTRKQSGTGLGLSIVKNIIIAHDGDISVSSEPGVGTTFTIVLPITKADSE